jgi:SEC-C motif
MFEKAGRNDTCPCGSGLKYKKCCLPKQEALLERLGSRRELDSLAGRKAVEWLNEIHEQQTEATIEEGFFGSIEKADRERLEQVPPGLHRRIALNLQDWLLNEASIELEGQRRPVGELIQAEAGKNLTLQELECLKAMGTHPLRLYEVESVKPGEGMALVDPLEQGRPPVWIVERTASRRLAARDLFGTRLLAYGDDGLVMSGAVYPFTREGGLACLEEIRRELPQGAGAAAAREVTSRHIIRNWLADLVKHATQVTEVPGEQDAEPAA